MYLLAFTRYMLRIFLNLANNFYFKQKISIFLKILYIYNCENGIFLLY